MGNPLHLHWLMEGVESWNRRRETIPFRPDLNGVDIKGEFEKAGLLGPDLRLPLEGVNFRQSNLQYANFWRADLRGASFVDADLSHARFWRGLLDDADLRGATLTKTEFSQGSLRGANLRTADLRDAGLYGTDLTDAILRYADLRGKDMLLNVISGTDLWNANLQGCFFQGKRDWSADMTDAKVDGMIVLRGVAFEGLEIRINETSDTDLSGIEGLTQAQINVMHGDRGVTLPDGLSYPDTWELPVGSAEVVDQEAPTPVDGVDGEELFPGDPADPADTGGFVFLSYARANSALISSVIPTLSAEGVPLWSDQDIQGGEKWREKIAGRLARSAAVLVLWTRDSVVSDKVIEEAEAAQSTGRLVHVRIDDVPLPYGFGETQAIDMLGWNGAGHHPGIVWLLSALMAKLKPGDARPNPGVPAPIQMRVTPVARFETTGPPSAPVLNPLNPMPHRPAIVAVDETLRDRQVMSVRALAEVLADQLTAYDEEGSNRATIAGQIGGYVRRLQLFTEGGGAGLLVAAFHGINEALARTYAEDAIALETADREVYKSLVDAGRALYPQYPELAEQLDPRNVDVVPEDAAVTAEELIGALEALLFEEETRGLFSNRSRDLFRAQVDALPPPGLDAEKDRIVRFGGLIGEIKAEMDRSAPHVQMSQHWIAASGQISAAWSTVAEFLGV